MRDSVLVADIGGTNVRFGLGTTPDQPVERIRKYKISDFPNPETAVRRYFDELGLSTEDLEAIRRACFCAAGPVEDDVVALTNGSWLIDKAQIARSFEQEFTLINDFSGLAYAIPYLPENELLKLGGGEPEAMSPKAIFGPGTGLGVSGAVPDRHGGWITLSGEGGHVAFAPRRELEDRILAILRRRITGGRVSAERILSGAGLEMLFESLAEIDRFCDAMIAIHDEAMRVREGVWPSDDNPLVNAPHPADDVIADDWPHAYSRQLAAHPQAFDRANKYWPPVSRIDGVAGDRNLVCTCPPLDTLAQARA